jgi:hypothetical protein
MLIFIVAKAQSIVIKDGVRIHCMAMAPRHATAIRFCSSREALRLSTEAQGLVETAKSQRLKAEAEASGADGVSPRGFSPHFGRLPSNNLDEPLDFLRFKPIVFGEIYT